MIPFSERVLAWYDRHGRKDLPWQQNRNDYRVWLSEIMLQQTQVVTVIPYFERFAERFADVRALAAAAEDEVLALWAGLGYYARARNLHRCAKQVVENHGGQFPSELEALMALPGIGRSTAGAIRAQAFNQRGVILDGNVKRVLARHQAVTGWPGLTATQQQLWLLADSLTPEHRHADYAQAIMDLGATLCSRTSPECDACPVVADCEGYRTGEPTQFPHRRAKKALPLKSVYLLLCRSHEDAILLEKRPPTGIWGGLWSLPQAEQLEEGAAYLQRTYGVKILGMEEQESFVHTFTHFRLQIQPVVLRSRPIGKHISEKAGHWYGAGEVAVLGMPRPVSKLVKQFFEQEAMFS